MKKGFKRRRKGLMLAVVQTPAPASYVLVSKHGFYIDQTKMTLKLIRWHLWSALSHKLLWVNIVDSTKGNLETVSFLKTVEIQCDTQTQTLPMSVSLDHLSVSVDNLSAPTPEIWSALSVNLWSRYPGKLRFVNIFSELRLNMYTFNCAFEIEQNSRKIWTEKVFVQTK